MMLGFVCRADERDLLLSEEVGSGRWVLEDDVSKVVSPDVAAVGVFKAYIEMHSKHTNWEAEF